MKENDNPIRLLEILAVGDYSVQGSIIKDFGVEALDNLNDFRWIIFSNPQSEGMVIDQCDNLKMDYYIIGDRLSMYVGPKENDK